MTGLKDSTEAVIFSAKKNRYKMQAGTIYMKRYNEVIAIVYRNICAKFEVELPNSQWDTSHEVVDKSKAKILWDFNFQTDKQLLSNQPDIVVVAKDRRLWLW